MSRFRLAVVLLALSLLPGAAPRAQSPPEGEFVVVTGRIVDPDGRPVEDALVGVQPPSPGDVTDAPHLWRRRYADTDREGRFRLRVPQRQVLHFTVVLHPWAELMVELRDPTPPSLDMGPVTLTRGARLALRLVDADGRALGTDGSCRIVPRMAGWTAFSREARPTDDGRLVAELMPVGTFEASIACGGVAPVPLGVLEFEEGGTLDLGTVVAPGTRVRGTVLDPDGSPLPGAEVRLYCRGDDDRFPRTRVATEGDGVFVLDGLDGTREPCLAVVEHPGFARKRVGIHPGEDVVVRLSLPGRIRVRARLAGDGEETPPPALRALAWREGNPPDPRDMHRLCDVLPSRWGCPRLFEGETPGLVELDGLEPGRWNVRLESPGALPLFVEGVDVRPGATTELGPVELDPGATLAGRVVDPGGRPVPGAEVEWLEGDRWLDNARRFLRPERRRTTTTDEAGRFVLRGLPPGHAALRVAAAGFVPVRVPVSPGAEWNRQPLPVRLEPGGALEGVATDEDGSPLAGARVGIVATDPRHDPWRIAMVGEDGRYRFDDLPAGTVYAVVYRGGAANPEPVAAAGAVIEPGTVMRQDISPASGAIVVTGRVHRGDEGVPAGLHFDLLDAIGHAELLAGTDRDGRFRVTLPGPGDWTIRVEPRDGDLSPWTVPTEIPAGAGEHRLDLAAPEKTLDGFVHDYDGNPVAGVEVFPWEERDLLSNNEAWPLVVATGEDGEFRLALPRDGQPWLIALREGFGCAIVPPGETGAGRGRAMVELPPTRDLAVRVLAPGGEPVPGALVVAVSLEGRGPGIEATRTEVDGSTVLRSLCAGAWRLVAWHPRYGIASLATPFPTEASELRLRLPRGMPVELVVRNPAGQPLPEVSLLHLVGPDGGDVVGAIPVLGWIGEGAMATDRTGRLLLPPLAPGRWKVEVGRPGWSATATFVVADAPVRVEIEADAAPVPW